MTDGNKSAVRDLVWPRADTVIWLDYPVAVSLWRLGKRALWRTSVIKAEARTAEPVPGPAFPSSSSRPPRACSPRSGSHRGQRRDYPRMFAEPGNQHLAVVRLRSPRATRAWLARVTIG